MNFRSDTLPGYWNDDYVVSNITHQILYESYNLYSFLIYFFYLYMYLCGGIFRVVIFNFFYILVSDWPEYIHTKEKIGKLVVYANESKTF